MSVMRLLVTAMSLLAVRVWASPSVVMTVMLTAYLNPAFSAVQGYSFSAGNSGDIAVSNERCGIDNGSAHSLVCAQNNLADLLPAHGGAYVQADDSADVLEREALGRTLGIHRRARNVTFHIILCRRNGRISGIEERNRIHGPVVWILGLATALIREFCVRGGAGGGINSNIRIAVYHYNLVSALPYNLIDTSVLFQGGFGSGFGSCLEGGFVFLAYICVFL